MEETNVTFGESLKEVQNEAFRRSIAIQQKLTTLNDLFSGIPGEFENIKNELFNPDNTNNEDLEKTLLTLKDTIKTSLRSSIVSIQDLKTLTDKSSDLRNSLDKIQENVGTLTSEIIRSNTNKEDINKEVILAVEEMTNENGETKKPTIEISEDSEKNSSLKQLIKSRDFYFKKIIKRQEERKKRVKQGIQNWGRVQQIDVQPEPQKEVEESLENSGVIRKTGLFNIKPSISEETEEVEEVEEVEEDEEDEETGENEAEEDEETGENEAEEDEEIGENEAKEDEELEANEGSLSREKSNEAWGEQTFPDTTDDNEDFRRAEEALREREEQTEQGEQDEQAQEQWGCQREESDTEAQELKNALEKGRNLYIIYKNFNLDILKKIEFITRENYDHFIYIILWLDNVYQTRKIDEMIKKSGIEFKIDDVILEIDNLIENFIDGSIITEKEVSKSKEFPLPFYYNQKIDYFKNYMLYIKSNFGKIPFYQDRKERKITKKDIKNICKNYKKHKDSQYRSLVRLKLSDDLLSFKNFIKIKNKYYSVVNNKNIKYIHDLMLKKIKKTILYYLEQLQLIKLEEGERMASDLEYEVAMANAKKYNVIPPENCVELIEDKEPQTRTLDELLNEINDDKPLSPSKKPQDLSRLEETQKWPFLRIKNDD